MLRIRSCTLFALLLVAACSTTTTPLPDPLNGPESADEPAWAAPPLEQAVAVRDGHTGASLTFDALLDELATADVVFLGETHTDETTHRVELAVLEGLLARRDGRVALAMEMFERDVQALLDRYLAGEVDEAYFLERSRPWGNYRTGYRPLVEAARAAGAPVVASNFPSHLRRVFATKKGAALEAIDERAHGWVPAEFHPNTPEYWRRVDNAVRGHSAMMRSMGGDGDPERTYATQSLWDNSMGDACAKALDANPGHSVLHVNGGFHSQYWDGTVRQLRLRKPDARVLTVSILPTANPQVAVVDGKPWADYVVFAESRADDAHEGAWSVQVQRTVKYRLHVPDTASDTARVPLLIWLPDDGLTAADGMDLWRARLGDDVSIAVLEPPYRERQEDMGEGGRWFWPDTFAGDLGSAGQAIGRTWGYLLRNFPVDPTRVCIAGEGTGATVVAAAGLRADGMDHRAVAMTPRKFAKIKDFPLPLPEYRGDEPATDKTLRVIARSGDIEWWQGELAEYAGIGFESELTTVTDDPWGVETEAENALRAALGLDPLGAGAGSSRAYVLAESDTPRARHWARLLALRHAAKHGDRVAVLDETPEDAQAQRVETGVSPEGAVHPGRLPPCPGPFGGTTVLVLPGDTPADQADAWVALEKNDPLTKQSRFLRVRVVTGTGERTLATMLAQLEAKGRKNVLIVPAEFCADGATMRALARVARPFEDRMTLRWMPGLGARTGGGQE